MIKRVVGGRTASEDWPRSPSWMEKGQGQGENGVVERLEDPVRLKSVSIGRKRYDQEEKSQRRTLLFKMSEVEVL